MAKITLETVQRIAKKEGYKLLNEEVNSSKDILLLICKRDHECNIRCTDFLHKGNRCATCKKSQKHQKNYTDFKNTLEPDGYKIDDSIYEIPNKKFKVQVVCSNNHLWEVCFTDYKLGTRCPSCNPSYKNQLSQEEVEQRYSEQGYNLITKYKSAREKIVAVCPNGHNWTHTHGSFQSGSRCSECFGAKKYTLDQARQFFIDKSFTPTFQTYNDNKQMLSFVCNKHKEYGEQFCSLHNLVRSTANCQVCYRDKFRGENSSRWLGGITSISKAIREYLFEKWTLPSLSKYDFKCLLSGSKENLEVHHANESYHSIIEKSLTLLGYGDKNNLRDFSLAEMENLKKVVLEMHYESGYGIPLEKRIHKLFHSIYGSKNNNMMQFIEFKENYEKGIYNKQLRRDE